MTKVSPVNKNVADVYIRRYLNTVSDWNTYLVPGAGNFGEQAEAVTGSFFGSKVLQGAAILLGVHLSQQLTAGMSSVIVRGWLRGDELGTHAGVSVRKLKTPKAWALAPDLNSEVNLFLGHSGLGAKLTQITKGLHGLVQVQDMYCFIEAGRSWVNYTLRLHSRSGPARQLTVLTMLAFPNRNYYFDRVLPFNQAINIARGQVSPETVPGFVGDTTELDQILPVVRLLKLGLYGLNWYLVEPAERDAAPPAVIEIAGYNTLVPPVTPPAGAATNPYTVRPGITPAAGARRPWSNPLRNPYAAPAYDWQGNPLPATNYFGAPTTTPVQTTFLPPVPATAPATINVAVRLTNKDNASEVIWVSVEGWNVLTSAGQPSGLAVARSIDVDQAGNFINPPDSWGVTHLETGRALNSQPFRTAVEAQQLAERLVAAIDWTKPFDRMTPAERAQAQAIINQL